MPGPATAVLRFLAIVDVAIGHPVPGGAAGRSAPPPRPVEAAGGAAAVQLGRAQLPAPVFARPTAAAPAGGAGRPGQLGSDLFRT